VLASQVLLLVLVLLLLLLFPSVCVTVCWPLFAIQQPERLTTTSALLNVLVPLKLPLADVPKSKPLVKFVSPKAVLGKEAANQPANV